jgi:uncharacterized protein YegP (UPF0339 family)
MSDIKPTDYVDVYQDKSGEWRWQIRATGNYEKIGASTEGYSDRRSAVANLIRTTGRTDPDAD